MDQKVNVEIRGLPKFAWLIWVIGGALSAVIGVWLLLNTKASIGTLALLLGFGLIFNGIAELAAAGEHPSPLLAYIVAALYVVGGLLVFIRPVSGLFALALVVGISVIVTGIGDLVIAFSAREQLEHWVVMAFLGVIGIVTGILAIAWPAITILILAILIGVRLIIFGLVQIGIGLRIMSLMI